jgi:hypothetical protein
MDNGREKHYHAKRRMYILASITLCTYSSNQFCLLLLHCSSIGYYSGDAALSCISCPAGYVTTTSGLSTCTACSSGYYCGEGASTCLICPSGYYADGTANTNCTSCEKGTYSAAAASGCTDCSAGTVRILSASAIGSCIEPAFLLA